MQVPIINGIFADSTPQYRRAYPRNMVPVPKQTGISEGYLRPGDGLVAFATGPGVDRGGILWNGLLYRVMGEWLVSVAADGTVTQIGSVGNVNDNAPVTLNYSFDYLGVASDGNLFLYDGSLLQQVVDPDLGEVLDFVWLDGYFVTTDGQNIVTTELTDPFSVNPLKYGSSELDPDPVLGLLTIENELYALNRHTIEVFRNVGGSGFPFQRIDGAQIEDGTIGTPTKTNFLERMAFMGGGRNKQTAIYLGRARRRAPEDLQPGDRHPARRLHRGPAGADRDGGKGPGEPSLALRAPAGPDPGLRCDRQRGGRRTPVVHPR